MALVTVYSAERQEVFVQPLETVRNLNDVTLVAAVGTPLIALARVLPLHIALKSYLFGSEHVSCTIGYRRDGVICHEPYRGSRGSSATYWLVHTPEAETLILVQYLHAGACTSTHWHSAEAERFYPLLGASMIHVGSSIEGAPWLASRQHRLRLALTDTPHAGIRVDPPSVHSLEATDGAPALNLIVIHPTRARTLQELNHNHVEWTP